VLTASARATMPSSPRSLSLRIKHCKVRDNIANKMLSMLQMTLAVAVLYGARTLHKVDARQLSTILEEHPTNASSTQVGQFPLSATDQ
jgi:hypothetical protein